MNLPDVPQTDPRDEERRRLDLIQQRQLEQDEDEAEAARRNRAEAQRGPQRPADAAMPGWRPNWLRSGVADAGAQASPTAQSSLSKPGTPSPGSNKVVIAGALLALAALVTWWYAAGSRSGPKASHAATLATMAEATDNATNPTGAAPATQSVVAPATTTGTPTAAPAVSTASTVATQAAPEFEIDATDWQALLQSTQRTDSRLAVIEGDVATIKDILSKLQQGGIGLTSASPGAATPMAAANPAVQRARAPRARPSNVANASKAADAAPSAPTVAPPTPQLLAVDMWDGKPSVAMQGPVENGQRPVRFFAVGDRNGAIVLRSADPRSQQAVFDVPGGEVLIEREDR